MTDYRGLFSAHTVCGIRNSFSHKICIKTFQISLENMLISDVCTVEMCIKVAGTYPAGCGNCVRYYKY